MKAEIGSEFWSVPTGPEVTAFFPDSAKWFLSGRSALKAIIKQLKSKKTVALPSWCCDSIVKPFLDEGMQVVFYSVFFQRGDIVQEINLDCDVLFLMDYFGYSSDVKVIHPCVIRDVTHSAFSKTYSDADYYFGSLRKWSGFWTGGFAWSKDKDNCLETVAKSDDSGYIQLRKRAMEMKDCYINYFLDKDGNKVQDKSYLAIYNKAEAILENIGIIPAAERDVALARKLDVEFIKNQRRKNALVLMQAFADQLLFPILKDTDCPMFVPIFVPYGKRNELRQYLIQHEIYCPVHWPVSVYHKLNEKTEALYKNELSLVCDQRYTEEDMFRIVETVKTFWKEN